MLDQRQRRWFSIGPTLAQVFAPEGGTRTEYLLLGSIRRKQGPEKIRPSDQGDKTDGTEFSSYGPRNPEITRIAKEQGVYPNDVSGDPLFPRDKLVSVVSFGVWDLDCQSVSDSYRIQI